MFTRLVKGRGIEVLRTPVRLPKANAIREWYIGSVWRECLDHILILNEQYLNRVIEEYVGYFNHARSHQGIGQRIPEPKEDDNDKMDDSDRRVTCGPVLGGLHHDYRRAA